MTPPKSCRNRSWHGECCSVHWKPCPQNLWDNSSLQPETTRKVLQRQDHTRVQESLCQLSPMVHQIRAFTASCDWWSWSWTHHQPWNRALLLALLDIGISGFGCAFPPFRIRNIHLPLRSETPVLRLRIPGALLFLTESKQICQKKEKKKKKFLQNKPVFLAS